MKKINISIDEKLLEQVDDYADKHFTTRSGFFTQASIGLLAQEDVRNSLGIMALAMKKIADTGTIDEKTQRDLEDFERICNMLSGAYKL